MEGRVTAGPERQEKEEEEGEGRKRRGKVRESPIMKRCDKFKEKVQSSG